MALGFGSTEGSGSGDRVTTAFTAHATQRSYGVWAYRSDGGSSIGRFFDKRTSSSQVELLHHDTSANVIVYERDYTIHRGRWIAAINPVNEWVHIGVSYDAGDTANDATIYFNGVSQVVTEFDAPAGSPLTNPDPYCVGNRGDGGRTYSGRLAEFAVWDRILTAEEWGAIGSGVDPLSLRRSLVCYVPLIREVVDLIGGKPSVTGGAIQTHPRAYGTAPFHIP
jgi:hypothetical protein